MFKNVFLLFLDCLENDEHNNNTKITAGHNVNSYSGTKAPANPNDWVSRN